MTFFAGGDHLFYAGHVVADLFCVLGTVYEAAAAQDAFIRDDIRLPVGKFDAFHRAVADAFVAVFAVRFFELQEFVHSGFLPSFASTEPAKISSKLSRFNPVTISVIHLNGDAVGAFAQAECGREIHRIREPVLFKRRLHQVDDVVGAFEVAGRTDTYADFHKYIHP